MESAGDGPDEHPLERLRRDGFFDDLASAPREPSAAERQRAATSAARQRDLARRLTHVPNDGPAPPGGRSGRRRSALSHIRSSRPSDGAARRRAVLAAVIVVVLGAMWLSTRDSELPAGLGASGVERPSDYPSIDSAWSDEPLGSPPAAPAEPGPYTFSATQTDGEVPVAWDPCRPIRYVINPAGAPAGGQEIIFEAVDRTAAASGFVFEYEGSTNEPYSKRREPFQPDRYGDRWAPLLISWDTESEVPDFAGDVAGMGGPTYVTDRSGDLVSVTGQITLSSTALESILLTMGPDPVRAVIQHELGHALGLGHVADPQQLMFAANVGRTEWGTGDLAGLSELGGGKCYPWV